MSLTYSLETAAHLYAKLQRDARALDVEVNGDNAFNFLVTAYHLAEWISRDPSVHPTVKSRMKSASVDPVFRLCADLANATKHFIQHAKEEAKRTEVTQGYNEGRFGAGAYGVGEEAITITRNDGSQIIMTELQIQIMQLHAGVFNE